MCAFNRFSHIALLILGYSDAIPTRRIKGFLAYKPFAQLLQDEHDYCAYNDETPNHIFNRRRSEERISPRRMLINKRTTISDITQSSEEQKTLGLLAETCH